MFFFRVVVFPLPFVSSSYSISHVHREQCTENWAWKRERMIEKAETAQAVFSRRSSRLHRDEGEVDCISRYDDISMDSLFLSFSLFLFLMIRILLSLSLFFIRAYSILARRNAVLLDGDGNSAQHGGDSEREKRERTRPSFSSWIDVWEGGGGGIYQRPGHEQLDGNREETWPRARQRDTREHLLLESLIGENGAGEDFHLRHHDLEEEAVINSIKTLFRDRIWGDERPFKKEELKRNEGGGEIRKSRRRKR